METNKTSLDDKISLIHGDLQKVVKHFRLDRRSKNNPEDQAEGENTVTDESGKQLREILERISEVADRKEFSTEQIEALKDVCNAACRGLLHFQKSPLQELKLLLEAVKKQIDEFKIERLESTVEHRHRHTIDIGSSKVFLSMVVMGLVILGLAYFVGDQRQTINRYRENDLKYRYVKMQGQTGEKDLYRLERQFKYGDSIKIICKQVEKYEKLVKEQAEKIERAKINASEAQRLKNEAETLRGGK